MRNPQWPGVCPVARRIIRDDPSLSSRKLRRWAHAPRFGGRGRLRCPRSTIFARFNIPSSCQYRFQRDADEDRALRMARREHPTGRQCVIRVAVGQQYGYRSLLAPTPPLANSLRQACRLRTCIDQNRPFPGRANKIGINVDIIRRNDAGSWRWISRASSLLIPTAASGWRPCCRRR